MAMTRVHCNRQHFLPPNRTGVQQRGRKTYAWQATLTLTILLLVYSLLVLKFESRALSESAIALPQWEQVTLSDNLLPVLISSGGKTSAVSHEGNEHVVRQLSVSVLDDPNNRKVTTANLPSTLIITKGTKKGNNICMCELVSVDCLDSIDCLPDTNSKSQQMIALGIYTRRLIKERATFEGEDMAWELSPMGKGTQYAVIDTWRSWTENNRLPVKYDDVETIFANSTLYPFCKERGLVGKNCFFTPNNETEEFDELELQALQHLRQLSPSLKLSIEKDLQEYGQKSREEGSDALPALGHLLAMAHILRLRFNRQPPVREFCRNMIRTYNAVPSRLSSNQEEVAPLRISLHLRRADSCDHERNSTTYRKTTSQLDSPAQPSSLRKCYETAVYLNALRRVKKILEENNNGQQQQQQRQIEVYLSSDNAGSLISEIRSDFPNLYKAITWHVLDYDRETFNYNGMIEGDDHDKHAMLGESAVADLWLLSHGEVFIGHLGSRFGKVSYLLATARHNRFVPFFSVDGHSYCCEIDEACGHIKPYIRTMENCLAFTHERHGLELNKDYWEIGSMKRKKAVLQEEETYEVEAYFEKGEEGE